MKSLRRVLAAVPIACLGLAATVAVTPAAHATGADLQITEFAYGGNVPGSASSTGGDGEYVEITNEGDAAQDLTGWSYDTGATQPTAGSGIALSGTLAPGASLIVTDLSAADFRTEWDLKPSVQVISNNKTHTLDGGPNAAYVFDAAGTVVDTVAYPAKGTAGGFSGKGQALVATSATSSPSTTSGWVAATADDAEGSWSSANGAIGSPGASTFGTSTPAGVRNETGTQDPSWADVSINEVSSDNATTDQVAAGDPLPDAIELYNSGDDAVDLTGWKQVDSGAASAATTFGPIYVNGSTTPATDMTLPAHGYAVFSSTKGLGSGGDGVKLYLPDGTLVDSVTYDAGQAGLDETADPDNTFKAMAACPDGSHDYLKVTSYSFGASNAAACATGVALDAGTTPTSDVPCTTEAPSPTTDPVTGAVTWPGSADVSVADDVCAWDGGGTQQDLSGLVFDPTDPDILWAVKNKSVVYKLTKTDGVWQKVTTDGWADGKDITFPGGTGLPDSEGMTVGPDGALYITTERDNANNKVPLDTILRFDPSGSGTTLTATDEWNLTSDLFAADDSADANLGFEGVTYVPDSYLTAHGFIDDTTHTFYTPATYPKKATAGLFFAAVEKTGHLEAYALDTDHTFTRVADIATGMAGVMDVSYDADLQRIWAQCDNTCGVTLSLLQIGTDGHFTTVRQYARPAGLPDNNLEGFALAPVSTAVDGQREAVWSDDGNFGTSTTGASMLADDGGHSLWSGLMDVDLGLGAQGYQAPSGTGGTGATGDTGTTGGTGATGTGSPAPVVIPPITGSPKVGHKLKVKLSLPAGATATYTWFAGGKKIKHAGKHALKLTKALRHKRIKVKVVVRVPGQAPVVRTLKVGKPVH